MELSAPTATGSISVDHHLGPEDQTSALRRDVLTGLTATPKTLSSKWFYDDAGCELFEAITVLPEYYPTRAERQILRARAPEIAAACLADTVVELGSGSSTKTTLLLGALVEQGTLRRFVPLDVSESTLCRAAGRLVERYPELEVHAVVGDFERHLGTLAPGGRRLVVFLGGTVGNLEPAQRATFFSEVAAGMRQGDALLLGTDLVKDVDRLVAGYDDDAGVTAAFNGNLLTVLNRELDANFDPGAFDHVARWDAEHEWIEMRLRSKVDQTVSLLGIDLAVRFVAGEELRTEVSAKFRRVGVEAELDAAGLLLGRWWTDDGGDFAVSLSFRR